VFLPQISLVSNRSPCFIVESNQMITYRSGVNIPTENKEGVQMPLFKTPVIKQLS
jgi:hypothetical protein